MISYQLDTNILLRYLTQDVPIQAKKVKELFLHAQKRIIYLEISEPVLIETIIMLRKYFKLPKEKTIKLIRSILALSWLEIENREYLTEAIHLYSLYSIDFVDCLILVRSRAKSQQIFSFDEKILMLTKQLEHNFN